MTAKKIQKTVNKIGEIVTLKSNHLKSENQYPTIWLAGEPSYVTPLMIIVEQLFQPTDKVDEESGNFSNKKGNLRYKCIWFSNKSFKIEENWFFEKELIEIPFELKSTIDSSINFGDSVVLKTNSLEIKKRKSYLELDNSKNNKKTSPLLTFSSPIFTVIGFNSLEKKEPLIDSHTGERKRWYCEKLVKVKSFNVKDDKYSEFLLPIEALEKLNEIDEGVLEEYVKAKNNGLIMSLIELDKDGKSGLFSINSLTSLSGCYFAETKNIFNQKIDEILISDYDILNSFSLIENLKKYPNIKEDSGSFSVLNISDYLDKLNDFYFLKKPKKAEKKPLLNNLFYIFYKNKYDKFTERYIIPIHLIKIERKEKDETKEDLYLKSYCLLRSDYRFFRLERIQSLEIVENDELFETGMDVWKNHI